MPVIQLEYPYFQEWLYKACEYIADKSKPDQTRNAVCEGLITTLATICEQWAQQDSIDKVFALVVKYDYDEGFSACIHNKVAQLQVIPEWYDVMLDTAQAVSGFQLDVLGRQGVFEEALEHEVPYLQYWYDRTSGLYKYSTQMPEEKSAIFS